MPPAVAWAANARRPLAESLQGPAKEAYTSAELLFDNGDYAGAVTKYRQAYEISKEPRLLIDTAICEKNLRQYARMQTDLLKFEREAGPTAAPEDKRAADDALAAIKKLVGGVTITTNEPGAAVSVDGEDVGTTPLRDPVVLDLGRHTFRAGKAGFEPAETVLEIPGGQNTSVPLVLAPIIHRARLVVSTDVDATVAIDGEVVAKGRFDGPLAPGAHELHLTGSGRKPYAAQFELHDGETRTLAVTLEAEHHGGPLWPWIGGGAVLAAGAVVGAYFLFKPSDTTTPVPAGRFASVTTLAWGRP
jgi:hypothetical protein